MLRPHPPLAHVGLPVILFLGKMFNGNKMWKETRRRRPHRPRFHGGQPWPVHRLVSDFIGAYGGVELSDWTWFTSSMWSTGVVTTEISFGFGVHIDHITVMLLFIASFLCLLINTFAIGYMNTDPINDNRSPLLR